LEAVVVPHVILYLNSLIYDFVKACDDSALPRSAGWIPRAFLIELDQAAKCMVDLLAKLNDRRRCTLSRDTHIL
jgi:hypothetical protein